MGQECGNIEVVDGHVPGGVGVRDQSCLFCLGKGEVTDKPLAFRVLADAAHPQAGRVLCSFPYQGKGFHLAEVCWAGCKFLNNLLPGPQF